MKIRSIFLLTLLLTCSWIYGQEQQPATGDPIAAVRIEGNKRIATETFLYYITVKAGSTYDPQVLRDDFKRLWQTGFLNDLKILADKTDQGVTITFKVEEKPLLKSIEYTGNKKVSTEDIDKKLKDEAITLRIDQPLDLYAVQKVSNVIQKLMVEKGLQFGSVHPKTEPLGDSYAKLVFEVDEGPKVRIGKIEFEGNKVFSTGKLRGQMKDTKQHGMLSFITRKDDFEKEKFEKDVERVEELYFNNGYIMAKIDEPRKELYGKNRMKLIIPVEEGDQYLVNDITFKGNKVIHDAELRSFIELKKGTVFNRSLLKKGLEEGQKVYGDRGYIYASLGPIFKNDEQKKLVNIEVQVEENGQFYINRIEFTGNNYTRDKVIRRELALQEGDLLRVNKFRESLDRIYRLGFFDDLKPNITPTPDKTNQADITIDVKENKRNEIRLGGGYSEFEGFFGNLVFSTKNLFGTGKVFTINLQGGSRSEDYGIQLLEPYFLDHRISLGFSVYKQRYDFFNFLRDTTGASVSVGFWVVGDWKGLMTYAYQVVDVGKTNNTITTPINDQFFPGFEFFQSDRIESRVVPSLLRSTINNPTDPSRGTNIVLTDEIVGGVLGGDLNYSRPSASFTQYLPGLSRRHYFAYNVEGGYGYGFGGQQLPFIERYFLGGDRSIRGYDIRRVGHVEIFEDPTTHVKTPFTAGGNKFFVLNAEYVIPIAGPLKIAAFLDYGNAFAKGQGIDFTDMRGSFGGEIRFLAPFLSAPFRFIYAVNFNRGELMTLPENLRPQRSVFRFSVGTTF
jgi:outer membrane protein insertion porin family